ncbi:hypothetical protein VTI74DRAFT_9173 [Chaetomium olivicolor]
MATNATDAPDTGAPFTPTHLISHFIGRDRKEQSQGWSELWDTNKTYWDRGIPSPALIDLVESGTNLIPKPSGTGGRKPLALVPGCGKGYDPVMLAFHGYDVYGLEVSPTAVETARKYAREQAADPLPYNFSNSARPNAERGQVKFINGDFFARDWEKECCSNGEAFSGFDLIYDYTFLCALLPSMRQDWARRMNELLAPSGVLVCLEFPLYKDLKLPGPPWGLREGIYCNLLAAGGNGMIEEEEEAAKAAIEIRGDGPFERIAHFKPARTYEIGEDTDMLGIWKLKTV